MALVRFVLFFLFNQIVFRMSNFLHGIINIIIGLWCVCVWVCVAELRIQFQTIMWKMGNNSNYLRVTCTTLKENNVRNKQIKYARQMSNTDIGTISNSRFGHMQCANFFSFSCYFMFGSLAYINISTQSRARLIHVIEIQNSYTFFVHKF